MSKAHFGLVGLGVMGENLVLNAERNGFSSVIYNRTFAKTEQFLLTLSSEQGPVRVFNNEGKSIGITRPGGESITIGESKVNVFNILPSSGILLKHDPGVPFVYLGFAITLMGSILSIISTNQIWIVSEKENKTIIKNEY